MPEVMVLKRKQFTLPFGLGLLAGLAFGFAGGLVYISFHRTVTAGDWQEWKYTGARDGASAGAGGGYGPLGIRGTAPAAGALQTTTDSFDEVANFYASKIGVNLSTAGVAGSQSSPTQALVYQSDNRRPSGQPRPVKAQTFARRTAQGSVVVFITRADGEEHTHILLYWLPRQ